MTSVNYVILGEDDALTNLACARMREAGASYVLKEPVTALEGVQWLDQYGLAHFPIVLEPAGKLVGGFSELEEELEMVFVAISGDMGAPKIYFRRMSDICTIPSYGSGKAIGMDLYMALADDKYPAIAIHPGERRLVDTNIQAKIPDGYYGRIAPRSGLAYKDGIDVLAGVIDSDYRGELKVILLNTGNVTKTFQTGDRIAQLILEKAARPNIEVVDNLDETERGAGGFGSTDYEPIKSNT